MVSVVRQEVVLLVWVWVLGVEGWVLSVVGVSVLWVAAVELAPLWVMESSLQEMKLV